MMICPWAVDSFGTVMRNAANEPMMMTMAATSKTNA
jgi:hypothetical protein